MPGRVAATGRRSVVLRDVGRVFAPAGDLLSCFAKKGGKEGDPPPPVGLRPTALRCSAGRNGLFGRTEPLRKPDRVLAVGHLPFLSPLARRLEVMTGGKRASHV